MFGRKTEVTKAANSSDEYINGCNKAAQRILEDFIWLWRILGYWSPDQTRNVKVNQDLRYLGLVLSRTAAETRFRVWVLTSVPCEIFNLRFLPVPVMDQLTWAEAVVRSTPSGTHILHVVTVDAEHCGDPCPHIAIFRSEDKQPLNETIEDIARMFKSGAQ